jgi:hypothetical protein
VTHIIVAIIIDVDVLNIIAGWWWCQTADKTFERGRVLGSALAKPCTTASANTLM